MVAEYGDRARGSEVLRHLFEAANSPDFEPVSLRASFAASIAWAEACPDLGRLSSCWFTRGHADIGSAIGREPAWFTTLILAADGCFLEAKDGLVVQFHFGRRRVAELKLTAELFSGDLITKDWKGLCI